MQRQRILSMTVSSSLTLAVAGYDRPTSTRVVFRGPTHGLATGDLQPLDRGSLWNSLPARIRQPDNDIGEAAAKVVFVQVAPRLMVTF